MQNKSDISFLKEIIKGNLLGCVLLILLLLISVAAILKFNLASEFYLAFYAGALIVSSFISSIFVIRKLRKKGLIYGITVSLLPSIIAFISTCLASKSISFIYLTIPLISAVSSAIGGISAVNIKKKRRRR